MKINYIIGNAVKPIRPDTLQVICHIVNDEGKWGSGFVLAINEEFNNSLSFNYPEAKYREWAKSKKIGDFVLGKIQLVYTREFVTVCNMVAQRSTGGLFEENIKLPLPNVNYSSLLECFIRLKSRLTNDWKDKIKSTTLHMPRIGTARGGGNWDTVEKVIQKALSDTNFEIYVYDYVP